MADSSEDGIGSLQLGSLAAAYRSGALDPRNLAAAVHERATARLFDNAWIQLRDLADLRSDAAELVARWPDPASRPPLFGIPCAVKDNIDVANLPTTAACPDFAYLPNQSAFLVQRLVDAGALVVGKTNLDQFASGLTGTRSPYGVCASAFDRSRVSGGSSSGSGVAVATGVVSFAIGTDTAGSGRVPAAFNNIVGLKPSRGRVSSAGIVPACRSLDCPSVLALSVADAWTVLDVIAGFDPDDPWSRPFPVSQPIARQGARMRIGVPRIDQLEPIDPAVASAFTAVADMLASAGHLLVSIDIEPVLSAGALMYQGPWVAERLTGLEPFLASRPGSVLPAVGDVLAGARKWTAVDAFRGAHRLAELAALLQPMWSDLDAFVLPTTSWMPTISDALADPQGVNASLGRYTNFCNLLDFAALAVPGAISPEGLPLGVTFYGPSGTDAVLAGIGAAFHTATGLPAGATGWPVLPFDSEALRSETDPGIDEVLLAVVGAHRIGQPLHPQLAAAGGLYRETSWTADSYRLYSLPAAGPARPGLIKTPTGGAAVEVELHTISVGGLGQLLVQIPAPLALGRVELADGRQVTGFVCEGYAAATGSDITEFGSWPRYLASMPPSPHGSANSG
jgi:allophanate hydrolase